WLIESEIYFENGDIQQKQQFVLPTGPSRVKKSASQRQIELETTAKPGQKDYDKSLLKTEKTVKTGNWTTYFKGKKVSVNETFVNDKLVGERTVYFLNGDIKEIQHYSHDIKTGNWKEFYEGGKIKTEATY